METLKIDNESIGSESWSSVYVPTETPAAYGLGLCDEGLISPKEQLELEKVVENMRSNRLNAQSLRIPLD